MVVYNVLRPGLCLPESLMSFQTQGHFLRIRFLSGKGDITSICGISPEDSSPLISDSFLTESRMAEGSLPSENEYKRKMLV